jgi:hypothetical protein
MKFEKRSLAFVSGCSILLLISSVSFSVRAQQIPAARFAASSTNAATFQTLSNLSSGSVAARVIGGRPNVADIIGSPPPAVGNTFSTPGTLTTPVYGFLPRRDTNPAIGVAYAPGSPEFIRMVAGLPPTNSTAAQPAVIPALPAQVIPPIPAVPPITYQRAGKGSRALMIREINTGLVRDFPPGASIRGVPSVVHPTQQPLAVISSMPPRQEPVTTRGGADLVQDFPPGTTLVTPGTR